LKSILTPLLDCHTS